MKPNILIVDDDPTICDALTRLLGRLGYAAKSVTSGVEAENRIASHNPDLVLLDIMMPEQDGYNTCLNVRQQGFNGTIVMISAAAPHTGLPQARGHGADSYLEKPISRNTLATCLNGLLKKHA